jgi:magnesium-transporting ATPase (P-type)
VNSKAAKWASKPLEDLLKELGTDLNKGVSSTEAEERRDTAPNRLVEEKEERFFDALREEITEPMILLLLTVGVI